MLGLSDKDSSLLLCSVGTHQGRRPLSPLEIGELLEKVVANGSSVKDCADELQVGQTQISTFLKLPKLNPEIQYLADWGRTSKSSIAFSSLAELSRLNSADQLKAASAILGHSFSWKEVIQLVQLYDRSSKKIDECIKDVNNLRPEVEIRHMVIGEIKSEANREILLKLNQGQRDALFKSVLGQLYGSARGVNGRLSASNFTITSTFDPMRQIDQDADGLEIIIDETITKKVESL